MKKYCPEDHKAWEYFDQSENKFILPNGTNGPIVKEVGK